MIARTMEELKMLPVMTATGGLHDLQDFTKMVYASGIAGINRVNQEKQIEITYSLVNEAQQFKGIAGIVPDEIDELVANYNFPSGVAIEVIHEETDSAEFNFLILAAIILIFMIMASVFESLSRHSCCFFPFPWLPLVR